MKISTASRRVKATYLTHAKESVIADIELPCEIVPETASAHFVPLSRLLVISLYPRIQQHH